jgi:hypothetical protein
MIRRLAALLRSAAAALDPGEELYGRATVAARRGPSPRLLAQHPHLANLADPPTKPRSEP